MTLLRRAANKLESVQLEARREIRRRLRPAEQTVPVFIVACQRSGTNMVKRVFELSVHATVHGQDEPRAFDGNRLREPDSIRYLIGRARTAVAVFKPMSELQHSRRFLEDFPELRIVWLLRSYRDVVNSSVRRWHRMREYLELIVNGGGEHDWFAEGISPRIVAVLREHYHADMSLETAYALFWYLRNSFYFELGLEREARVIVRRYEELVREPVAGFANLFRWCGCPFEPKLVREVHANSIRKNAPPALDPAIESLCDELMARFDRAAQPAGGAPGC